MLLDNLAYRVFKTKDYGILFFWLPKFMLGSILMWPSMKKRFSSTIAFLVIEVSAFATLMGIFFYVYENIHEFSKAVFGISLTIIPLMTLLKFPVIWFKTRELENIIKDIKSNFWPYDIVDDETKAHIKQIYSFTVTFMISFFCIANSYAIYLFLPPLLRSERTLPYPSNYPWDWKKSPSYEILFIMQFIGLECGAPIGTLGTDFMGLCMFEGAANQYRILQKCFKAFNTDTMIEINNKLIKLKKQEVDVKENYEDVRRKYLFTCIQHHEFLLGFTNRLIESFNLIELGQLLISVLGICLSIFMLSKPTESIAELILPFVYFSCYLNQLVTHCIVGTDLHNQANLLSDCIYQSNWSVIEEIEMRKDIAFALQHSQRYPQLTAYNIYDMNMFSFVKV